MGRFRSAKPLEFLPRLDNVLVVADLDQDCALKSAKELGAIFLATCDLDREERFPF